MRAVHCCSADTYNRPEPARLRHRRRRRRSALGAQAPSYKQQSSARLQPVRDSASQHRERPGSRAARAPTNEAVSIADLSWPLPRPSYLACPPGYCAAADMPSPIFDMPWDQLREYWKEMIVETAAILVVSEFEHRRAVHTPRSPIFGFPDIVMVEFVTLGPERSSVAVDSRSRYGGYDFTKNRKRGERWLFVLQEVAHA